MKTKNLFSLGATVAIIGGKVSAFWRMECRGVAGQARIDPMISPGTVAAHAHQIFGSGGLTSTAKYADLVASDCTSCGVTQDKSAYWVPIPYFQDNKTGEFEAVANVGGLLAYYFLGENTTAFPKDFRMIAGDTDRRNYTVGDGDYERPDPEKSSWRGLNQVSQADLAQRAVGFNCMDYSKHPEGTLYRHFMPSKDYIDAHCPDGIRMELAFPMCWDGKTIDSHNHKSHVAYSDLVIGGNCPADFPVRLPQLMFESIWDMAKFANRTGMFVLSNGDPYGFGYHGDFIMGWEENDKFKLQDAVNVCTNSSGRIQDCPIFNLQDEGVQNECKLRVQDKRFKENVKGPLRNLPGDAKICWGPGPANADESPSGPVDLPTVPYSAGSTASVNGSFAPGNVFKAAATPPSEPANKAPEEAPVVTPVATPTLPAVVTPAVPDEIAVATSFSTTTLADGTVVVNAIVIEEVVDYVTSATTTTVYEDPAVEPKAYRRHLHGHHRRHTHGESH